MKYLIRNLLIIAAPILLRALFKRMDERPATRASRGRLR
jgi:hypothetical protein